MGCNSCGCGGSCGCGNNWWWIIILILVWLWLTGGNATNISAYRTCLIKEQPTKDTIW